MSYTIIFDSCLGYQSSITFLALTIMLNALADTGSRDSRNFPEKRTGCFAIHWIRPYTCSDISHNSSGHCFCSLYPVTVDTDPSGISCA